jgi:hypothetical protein
MDTSARTLTGMINDSIQPVTNASSSVPVFEAPGFPDDTACDDAEYNFLTTIGSLGRVTHSGDAVGGAQIVVHGNQPILLRKALGEKTALSLVPLVVNGVRCPAGSIISMAISLEDQAGDLKPRSDRIDQISSDFVSEIAFNRLSIFALPPAERDSIRYYNRDVNRSYPKAANKQHRTLTMDDINHRVAIAVSKLQSI